MRCRLEDLPPSLQAQVREKLGMELPGLPPAATKTVGRVAKTPNKTEADYRRQVLDTNPAIRAVVYEGLTFRMANGHRYTPDWVCVDSSGRLICIEVKGAYRLGSYQRARLAFDQAAVEWPSITWLWAERRGAEWCVTVGGNGHA